MSYFAWLSLIRSAKKASVISKNVRKIHYTFPDMKQMVEEYSMDTGVVLRRAWKKPKEVMGEHEWEVELGEDIKVPNRGNFLVKECDTTPILIKRITKRNIEWRIRNLPYPIETYSVTAEGNCITVRTTNRKYFKKITVPELERCGLVPSQDDILVNHQFNTLIIMYKKPALVSEMEAAVLKELQDVETETDIDDFLDELLAK